MCANDRRASHFPSTCRANAWSSRRRAACHCCGGHRLRKLGEDMTETLEV